MKRSLRLLPVLLLALSFCAFGQITDPNVGVFNPSAACAPTCGTDPNPISLTEFGVWNYGNAGTPLPWYILFAVPNDVGGAPTLTSDASSPDSFTASGPTDVGAYLSSSAQTEYEFAASATTLTAAEINAANNSMNTSNMFGTAEQAAFGGTPTSFEVFVYSMNPDLPNQVAELFDTSIVAGTFVTVLGATSDGKHVFATPFTTSGLGGSSASTSTSTSGPGGGPASGPQIPEPNTIVLLGSALLAVTAGLRKKLIRS
jgi:hypothetical protein